jgi:hypothetical protein
MMLFATLVQADTTLILKNPKKTCHNERYEFEGVIIQKHKKGPPYPFTSSRCPALVPTVLRSKIVVDELYEDEKYVAYITDDTVCHLGPGQDIPCSELEQFQKVHGVADRNPGRHRGIAISVDVLP